MSFNLTDVLADGVDRLATAVGAILVVVSFLAGLASTVAAQDLLRIAIADWQTQLQETDPELAEQIGPGLEETLSGLHLAVGLSPGVATVLWIVATIASLAIVIVAFETFGRERDHLTTSALSGVGWKTLNFVVGAIVFAIVFTIGIALLVLPGLVVLVLFFFFPAAIAIDGDNFVSAFGSSVAVVRENAFGTIGLLVVAIVAGIAVSIIAGIVAAPLPPVAGGVVGEVASALVLLYAVAIVGRAYVDATTDDAVERTENEADEREDEDTEDRGPSYGDEIEF